MTSGMARAASVTPARASGAKLPFATGRIPPRMWGRPAPRPSEANLSRYPTTLHGGPESLVVPLVLVRVGLGEGGESVVERRALAQVRRDGDAVARAGVGQGERLAPGPPVAHLALGHGLVRIERTLPVPELADVEVAALPVLVADDPLPAEEDVADALHDPLAGDDPLALVGEAALADEAGEDRRLRLLHLQEEWIAPAPAE